MATEERIDEEDSGLPPGFLETAEQARAIRSGGAPKERTFAEFLAEQRAAEGAPGAAAKEQTFEEFLAQMGGGQEEAPAYDSIPQIPPDSSTLGITMREGLGAGAYDLGAKVGNLLLGGVKGMVVDPVVGLASLPQAVGAIPEKLKQMEEENPFRLEKAKESLLNEGYSEPVATYLAGIAQSVGSPFYYGGQALEGAKSLVTSAIPFYDLLQKNEQEKQQFLQELESAKQRGAITEEQYQQGLDYATVTPLELLTIPGTPQTYEDIGREIGGVVGPGALIKGSKVLTKAAGKALESEKLEALVNLGRNKGIKETKQARAVGGSVITTKVLSRTTDAEKQIFNDAIKFEDRYRREAKKILKDVPSSPEQWRESPELFEKVLGKTTETGERIPGAFRKYIDRFKKSKENIAGKVDKKLPHGLAVEDIDINRLKTLIDTYEKNSFKKEVLGLAESGLENFESDFLKSVIVDSKGQPLSKGFSGLTMKEANKYIRQIDDELRKIGYYDDKTYRSIISDPSMAARVEAEGGALRAIRQTLQDAQEKAITTAVGPKTAKGFKEANRNIAMAIEYENIWRRFMPQTLEQAVTPTGSSLNTSVRTGNFVTRGFEGAANLFGDLTEGSGLRKALTEQREAVEEAKNISKIYTGELPGVETRKFPRLTGIDTTLTPGQKKAAVIGAPLTMMMTGPEPTGSMPQMPQMPNMTPEQPATNSLIEALGGGAGVPAAEAITPTTTTTTSTMPEMPTTTMPQEPGFESPEAAMGGMPPMGAGMPPMAPAEAPAMPGAPMPMPQGMDVFAAPPVAFQPIKPSTKTILTSFDTLAPQLQQVLPPEEGMNVLDTLNEAIQSKSDDALGRTVTAMLKQYPETRTLFVDEFPDMPIFTFNKKIYQEDDKRAFEKIINDSKASSISKSKSLSALNRDGSVIMPR